MTPLSAFTLPTAARLTGLREARLRKWDSEGFFEPSLADPNRRRHYSRVYSFRDIVALRTIQALLARGVPIGRLKKLDAFLRSFENAGWASLRFYVVGRDVYFTYGEALLAAKPLGQMAMREILEFSLQPIVDETRRKVADLSKRSEDQIGRITTDRYIMNGMPVIAGTRTPTAVVYELHRDGYGVEEIREEFPRLTPEDIQAAIAFHVGEPLPKAG